MKDAIIAVAIFIFGTSQKQRFRRIIMFMAMIMIFSFLFFNLHIKQSPGGRIFVEIVPGVHGSFEIKR